MILLARKCILLYNTYALKIMFFLGDLMAKVSVSFELRSSEGSSTIKTKGLLQRKQLIFYDESKTKHVLSIEENRLNYVKKDAQTMDFSFQKTILEKGYYHVGNYQFSFDIKTKKLVIEPNKIEVEYDVLNDDELVNSVYFKLIYKQLEEI